LSDFACGAQRNMSTSSSSISLQRKLMGCYRRTVIVLSDHPRWMFRKNSMEFFVGLNYYLYYFTSGCTLKSHSHESFQNVLWSHDLLT